MNELLQEYYASKDPEAFRKRLSKSAQKELDALIILDWSQEMWEIYHRDEGPMPIGYDYRYDDIPEGRIWEKI